MVVDGSSSAQTLIIMLSVFAFGRLRPWSLRRDPLMAIVGGLDIHRKQITFDCLDTDSGELRRGRIVPADRAHLADWLARHAANGAETHLGFEGWYGVALGR